MSFANLQRSASGAPSAGSADPAMSASFVLPHGMEAFSESFVKPPPGILPAAKKVPPKASRKKSDAGPGSPRSGESPTTAAPTAPSPTKAKASLHPSLQLDAVVCRVSCTLIRPPRGHPTRRWKYEADTEELLEGGFGVAPLPTTKTDDGTSGATGAASMRSRPSVLSLGVGTEAADVDTDRRGAFGSYRKRRLRVTNRGGFLLCHPHEDRVLQSWAARQLAAIEPLYDADSYEVIPGHAVLEIVTADHADPNFEADYATLPRTEVILATPAAVRNQIRRWRKAMVEAGRKSEMEICRGLKEKQKVLDDEHALTLLAKQRAREANIVKARLREESPPPPPPTLSPADIDANDLGWLAADGFDPRAQHESKDAADRAPTSTANILGQEGMRDTSVDRDQEHVSSKLFFTLSDVVAKTTPVTRARADTLRSFKRAKSFVARNSNRDSSNSLRLAPAHDDSPESGGDSASSGGRSGGEAPFMKYPKGFGSAREGKRGSTPSSTPPAPPLATVTGAVDLIGEGAGDSNSNSNSLSARDASPEPVVPVSNPLDAAYGPVVGDSPTAGSPLQPQPMSSAGRSGHGRGGSPQIRTLPPRRGPNPAPFSFGGRDAQAREAEERAKQREAGKEDDESPPRLLNPLGEGLAFGILPPEPADDGKMPFAMAYACRGATAVAPPAMGEFMLCCEEERLSEESRDKATIADALRRVRAAKPPQNLWR